MLDTKGEMTMAARTIEERVALLEKENLNIRIFLMRNQAKINALPEVPGDNNVGEIPGGQEAAVAAEPPPPAPDVPPVAPERKLGRPRRTTAPATEV